MSEASGKFLSIGMPGDDCCFCGPVIVERSGEPTTVPTDIECLGHCTGPLPLYGEPDGNPPDFCFPYTCCPCSSGGTVTASLVVTSASGGLSKDLELSSSESGMCIGHPVMCYNDTGPYYNSRVPAEKYGVQNVELCAPAGGCSGQRISASLCCCENSDAMGPTRGTGDCHTCNYQFTIYWLTLDMLGLPYCFCPTEPPLEPPTHLLPGDGYVPAGVGYIYDRFELVDSTCDPFYLYYEATGQYWNCDCLQAGDVENVDNTVTLAVTITR